MNVLRKAFGPFFYAATAIGYLILASGGRPHDSEQVEIKVGGDLYLISNSDNASLSQRRKEKSNRKWGRVWR